MGKEWKNSEGEEEKEKGNVFHHICREQQQLHQPCYKVEDYTGIGAVEGLLPVILEASYELILICVSTLCLSRVCDSHAAEVFSQNPCSSMQLPSQLSPLLATHSS